MRPAADPSLAMSSASALSFNCNGVVSASPLSATTSISLTSTRAEGRDLHIMILPWKLFCPTPVTTYVPTPSSTLEPESKKQSTFSPDLPLISSQTTFLTASLSPVAPLSSHLML